jgi:hypothetical protein
MPFTDIELAAQKATRGDKAAAGKHAPQCRAVANELLISIAAVPSNDVAAVLPRRLETPHDE